MDGIFGVGLAEMVLIALAILIIGGPRNAAKWARDLGKMMAQFRKMWQEMMKELEKELGEDGKELMTATRELQQNVNQLRNATNPVNISRQANKLLKETTAPITKAIDETKAELNQPVVFPSPPDADAPLGDTPTTNGRYSDWTS